MISALRDNDIIRQLIRLAWFGAAAAVMLLAPLAAERPSLRSFANNTTETEMMAPERAELPSRLDRAGMAHQDGFMSSVLPGQRFTQDAALAMSTSRMEKVTR